MIRHIGMAPFVVVELPAAETGSPHSAALVAACTAGLRQGRCAVSGSGAPAETPTAIAIVTFGDPDRLQIRVEVGTRRDGRTEWSRRDLRFQPVDAERERWRSAGFAVASLAAEAEEEGGTARQVGPRAESKVDGHPRAREGKRLARGGVAASARFETGPGLDRGPFRLGAGLGASYLVPGTSLSVGLQGGHAIRPDAVPTVDLSWTTVGGGAGLRSGLGAEFEARAFVAPLVRLVHAAATDPETGAEAVANRWLFGALLEGSLRWPRSSSVGAMVGASLVRLTGGTAVRIRGQRAASSPALEPGLFMGLEARL